MEFIFGDKAYRDGIDMSPDEFYTRLRWAEKQPTTSGSSPGPFLEAYRRASQQASRILCITIPSKLSGMFNSAQLAKETAKKTIPGVIIEIIDCRTAAVGQGLVVLAAARVAEVGKSLAEVVATTRRVMERVSLFATLGTLHYLVKGGRVPKAAELASSLLQIKPIFSINDGNAFPVTNARTYDGAIKRILKMMERNVVKGKPLYVAVMHADALERAVAIKQEIAARFDCTELFITEFTPVMGVHTGPGVVGVAFYNED